MPRDSSSPPAARIGPSWMRRRWLMLTAWMGDHLFLSLLAAAVFTGAVLFYGLRLNGFAHLTDSLRRCRMEIFGGTYHVERSIEVPEVILSFREEAFDRVDAATSSAGFLGGSAFRQEIAAIAARPGAKLRIIALDPRLADPSHPHHAEFKATAAAFGMEVWEYGARCRHSSAVLLHLLRDFAPTLEARLLSERLPSATDPFFTPGRSLQLYRHDDPAVRLDVLVPRPNEADGMDSFSHPGLIIRHRPDDSEVRRFSAAFAEGWDRARPFDAALQAEILKSLTSPP